jgi:hypothetical protein
MIQEKKLQSAWKQRILSILSSLLEENFLNKGSDSCSWKLEQRKQTNIHTYILGEIDNQATEIERRSTIDALIFPQRCFDELLLVDTHTHRTHCHVFFLLLPSLSPPCLTLLLVPS